MLCPNKAIGWCKVYSYSLTPGTVTRNCSKMFLCYAVVCVCVFTPPKQRPGTKPWLKNPIVMSVMAGTALMIANMSLSSKGPCRGLWCDCNSIHKTASFHLLWSSSQLKCNLSIQACLPPWLTIQCNDDCIPEERATKTSSTYLMHVPQWRMPEGLMCPACPKLHTHLSTKKELQ
jgi:hypothetical protein